MQTNFAQQNRGCLQSLSLLLTYAGISLSTCSDRLRASTSRTAGSTTPCRSWAGIGVKNGLAEGTGAIVQGVCDDRLLDFEGADVDDAVHDPGEAWPPLVPLGSVGIVTSVD